MALTTLNLAALPVKFVAVPVLAGLAAGTGAFAAYVTGPAPAAKEQSEIVAALPAVPAAPLTSGEASPAKPAKKPSCEQQTWPYIDNRCIAHKGGAPAREVRLVMASREGDVTPGTRPAPTLVTSDGVLRGPNVAPEADKVTPAAKPETRPVTKVMRRTDVRRAPKGRDEFRRVYSVYSVPSAGSTKPVIVVRPLRLNTYSSRF